MTNPYKDHFKKISKNKKQNKSSSGIPTQKNKKEILVKKKRKRPIPLGGIVGSVLMLTAMLAFHWKYEEVESFISRIEIRIFGETKAQTTPADRNKSPSVEKKEEKKSSDKGGAEAVGKVSIAGLTDEEVSLFNSLYERKGQLDQREARLQKMELELQQQKKELEKRLAELEQLRTKIGNQLQERVTTDEEKVGKLVDFYSNMKPLKAAKVFETMNEDLAVEILKKMKKTSAAEIMNLVEAEKARKLSEKFAGYRRN